MKRNGVEEKKRRKENHAVLLFSIEWARTREYYLFSIKKKRKEGIVDSYSTYTRSNTFTTDRTP